MKPFHLSVIVGILLLLAGVLTGCALLFPEENTQQTGGVEELASPSPWVIAAQGEDEPQVCEQGMSRWQARKEAKEALKGEEEAQALKQTLAQLGKRVLLWRAQGCVARAEDEVASQGLVALDGGGSGAEVKLVEVPAGRDAALYLVESGDEGNYWVSLKEQAEGGERLIHIEVGLKGEAEIQGLSAGTGAVSFLLPGEEGIQEIAGQVQGLLEGSGAEGAGLRAMGAKGELDWSRAEAIILDGNVEDGEEAEALLVVPAVETEGQRLWGPRGPMIEEERALYAQVRARREGSRWRVRSEPTVRWGRELRPAFRFCPYRYYGRLSPFRRVLCQGSWERWYYKQWKTGNIYDKWAALYNQAAKLASANGGVPSTFLKGSNLLLYGFERLEGSLVREMVDFAREHPWQAARNPFPLPPLPQESFQALAELVKASDDPGFAQRVAEVEEKYPLFAEMLTTMALPTQWDKVPLARRLAELAQQDEQFGELWARFGRLLWELQARGIIARPAPGEPLPTECCSPVWRGGVFSALVGQLLFDPKDIEIDLQLAYDILDHFFTVLEQFLTGEQVYPGVDVNQLIASLLNLIPGVVIRGFTPHAPGVDAIREFVRLMQLIGNMVVKGAEQGTTWQFIEIGRGLCIARVLFCTATGRIDLIATAYIPGLGQVTTFARAYDRLTDENSGRIRNEIQALIDFAAQHAADYPGREAAFVFVGGKTKDTDVDALLARITATVPVVAVYCRDNCNGPHPIYALKWKGNLTEQQARQIACAHGFTQFCEGSSGQDSGGEPPSVETPPPPTPPPGSICSSNLTSQMVCIQSMKGP